MLPIKVTNDFLFVKTPYSEKEYVQSVLNGVWSKKEGMYRFPKNIHAMTELLKNFPDLQMNKDFMELGRRLKVSRERSLELRKETFVIDERLRPYQNVDVRYLSKLPAAGIFNEPRTGKTPTSIILMKKLGTKRNLVVCPASLIWNWAKEFEQWFPQMKVFIYQGPKKKRSVTFKNYLDCKDRAVLIISKDTLKSDINDLNCLYGACFVDEAHFLRNRDTAQSKAIYAIKADRRYALTGTPTVKHGTDIYGILKFLYPAKFSSYWQFVERYWEMGQDWMGHAEIRGTKKEREKELTEMIGFLSVQRKRKEVMQWLPDKQRITHYCVMEGPQLRAYKQMLDDFCTEISEEEMLDAANVLTQFLRLRQLCLDPRLVGIDAPSAKTKALLEWLDDNREPVVVMSMFTSYFDLVKKDIEKLGLRIGMIHGKMSNVEKEQAKVDFQSGKIDVLLCNIISAGVGFTLDRAETILFTDLPWNNSDLLQAEDRIMPTTEDRNHKVCMIYLTCSDSVDDRISQIILNKRNLTDIINEGGREAIERLIGKVM